MPSQRVPKPDVVVIGGGVSGLAAAVDLASHDLSVLLIEQKQHCGGRTYSFLDKDTGDEVDNGQHLMMGCYHSTLKFLSTINTLSDVRIQKQLSVTFRDERRGEFLLRSAFLPGAAGVLAGLLRLRSLSGLQRISLLRVGAALMFASPDDDHRLQSITVTQWLNELHQSEASRKYLWNIIAIGTLNESPDVASAALFAKVLQSAFLGSGADAAMVIPTKGLSRILVDAAVEFLEQHHSAVLMNTSVDRLVTSGDVVSGIGLSSGETITPRAAISAVPYFDLPKMLGEDHVRLFPKMNTIGQFIPSPIISIHLWFDRHFIDEDFVALLDSPVQWVFNKSRMYDRADEKKQFLSLVISAAGDIVEKEKDEIVAMALNELRRFYPNSAGATLVNSLVIKEKRATFSPRPGMEKFRPGQATPLRNFFLAGDWTDTKLPATIEGAVQSGYVCSGLVRKYLASHSHAMA